MENDKGLIPFAVRISHSSAQLVDVEEEDPFALFPYSVEWSPVCSNPLMEGL